VTVQTLHVTAPSRTARSGRLDFLDALRGIAVCLVLLQHLGELLFPAVARLSTHGVQLGQLGVTVFFLCSGFIIPASLERARAGAPRAEALRDFWRSRVFRLYPLYWVSLAGAAVLVLAGRSVPAAALTPADWLANATMLQAVAGSPHALPLYWTLAFEMIFYVTLSALFLLGRHRHSVALSLAVSAGCVVGAVSAGLLGRSIPLGLFCLATMFTGTVFSRWHAGAVHLRTLVGCVAASLTGGAALLAAAAGQPGEPAVLPLLTAWLGAYAIFGAGLALRSRTVPHWLRRLGAISFSVYLVQALVLLAVPALPSPTLTAVVWTALILAISEGTYRVVELPAVRLGRRLGARTPHAVPATPIRSIVHRPRPAGHEQIAV
jgi:peptidoglycan/LPS O-acetylase OafA/YrhL